VAERIEGRWLLFVGLLAVVIGIGAFAVWVGLTSRLMVGVVFNWADGPSLGIGLGPLYFGIGGYDR